jgi:hypothetical protein
MRSAVAPTTRTRRPPTPTPSPATTAMRTGPGREKRAGGPRRCPAGPTMEGEEDAISCFLGKLFVSGMVG